MGKYLNSTFTFPYALKSGLFGPLFFRQLKACSQLYILFSREKIEFWEQKYQGFFHTGTFFLGLIFLVFFMVIFFESVKKACAKVRFH